MNKEITKTSLLSIATLLSAVGGAIITVDILKGCIVLTVAVAILIIRGVLKAKGIALESTPK